MKTIEERISEVSVEYHKELEEAIAKYRRKVEEIVTEETVKRRPHIDHLLGDKK